MGGLEHLPPGSLLGFAVGRARGLALRKCLGFTPFHHDPTSGHPTWVPPAGPCPQLLSGSPSPGRRVTLMVTIGLRFSTDEVPEAPPEPGTAWGGGRCPGLRWGGGAQPARLWPRTPLPRGIASRMSPGRRETSEALWVGRHSSRAPPTPRLLLWPRCLVVQGGPPEPHGWHGSPPRPPSGSSPCTAHTSASPTEPRGPACGRHPERGPLRPSAPTSSPGCKRQDPTCPGGTETQGGERRPRASGSHPGPGTRRVPVGLETGLPQCRA